MKLPIGRSFPLDHKTLQISREYLHASGKMWEKPLKNAENSIFAVDIELWISYDTKESIIVYVNFAQVCPNRMQKIILLLFFNHLCNRF